MRDLITTPIGEARLNIAQRRAELERQQAELLARIALECDDVPLRPLSLLGDERQLRGLPAVGRGCRGAIAGTVPGDSLR